MDGSSKIIGENVAEIRDAIGLSQKDFASLAGISRATLVNIESGNKPIKVVSLDKIAGFSTIGLDKLSKRGFKPPDNLREKLLQLYKNSPEIYVILSGTPSIPYIIKYRVLKIDFLNTPKERGKIVKFVDDNYGWKITGNSLTNALKRMPDLIKIEPHPSKGGTNVYSRKK
ncbi:helix-turn-helix domain-containing protein [Parapedobacter koreensis]|uniref:Helix-turn-helix n=1 Tax=Parapedobacter koreensis TaxID=332977 RepID=A0A1H7TX61_9SPHI|nr:helix-turn-helix transcriptional regulator [Parapedobacter koreensis]SEL89155.1 Helix-turn-helix [Parapedobacter koreensis]